MAERDGGSDPKYVPSTTSPPSLSLCQLLTQAYHPAHARAVHAAQIRPTSTLDVVTSICDIREGNTIHPGYMAHVIIYERPPKKEWKILTSGEPKATGGEALEYLLHELQVQLGDSIGELVR